MPQLPPWMQSPVLFFGLAAVGLLALWFSMPRLIEWMRAPRKPLPGHVDDITTKDEIRPGVVGHGILVLSCVLAVTGLAGAAVHGGWQVPDFNAVVRTSGLVLDVAGAILLAGSVPRSTVAGEGDGLFWDQQSWETPGLYLVVTGFLLQTATAFEALQVAS